MKRTKSNKPVAVAEGRRIKLKIDSRTVIVVRSQAAVEMWLKRFPAAQVVE